MKVYRVHDMHVNIVYTERLNVSEDYSRTERRRPGRKKRWSEQLRLPLAEGCIARIDSVLFEGEARVDLIRVAIEKEIRRRCRSKK